MAVIGLCYCVTLWHISIAGWVILHVTFQKVDAAPNTQRTAEAHNDSLQCSNCAIEKRLAVLKRTLL